MVVFNILAGLISGGGGGGLRVSEGRGGATIF